LGRLIAAPKRRRTELSVPQLARYTIGKQLIDRRRIVYLRLKIHMLDILLAPLFLTVAKNRARRNEF